MTQDATWWEIAAFQCAARNQTQDAMLLAAGLGLRMRPLTEGTAKPLLPLGGRPLPHRAWLAVLLVAATAATRLTHGALLGHRTRWRSRRQWWRTGDGALLSAGSLRHRRRRHAPAVIGDDAAGGDAASFGRAGGLLHARVVGADIPFAVGCPERSGGLAERADTERDGGNPQDPPEV